LKVSVNGLVVERFLGGHAR